MADDEVEILLRNGQKVFLPPGTKVWKALSNDDVTTYYCPDGDRVEVDRRNRTVRNVTKGIDLGEPR